MKTVKRWFEYEDWTEFYNRRQIFCTGKGIYQVLVNFGGPGGATPYHFYARVKKGKENCIKDIKVEGEEFTAKNEVISVPGTPADFNWVYLGFLKTRRGYRMVRIYAPEGLSGLERLCVLEVLERLQSGEIERRISLEPKGGEPLSGVPLGGVGAGKIEFCRDGLFRNITINGNIDTPVWRSEGSFFMVRVEGRFGALSRIISSHPLHNIAPVEKIEFTGIYPVALLRASDRDFPLCVEIDATGPIIPQDIKNSSLPIALFNVRLMSMSEEKIKATAVFCMENFLGCGGSIAKKENWDKGYYEFWEERKGNTELEWKGDGCSGMLFTGGKKEEKRSQGEYIIATDFKVSSVMGGIQIDNMATVWEKFTDTGRLPGVSNMPSAGEPTSGAIAVELEIKPGEVWDIKFVFIWYVPYFSQTGDIDYGHYYTNYFSSAGEIAEYGLKNFNFLKSCASELPSLLQKSTLPQWFSKTLCNDAYIFSTGTWLTKDGRFSVNESPTHMFGCMGTLDQKLYGNHYYSLFFPQLDRTELLAFAESQGEDGGIQHDLGYGYIDQKGVSVKWPDLSSALVILSLKHYQLTADEEYIKRVYPHLVKGLFEFQLGMDTDGDGIPNISGVGNTFDAEKFEGTCSYIATLWLSALKSLEKIAVYLNDKNTAERCRQLFNKARESAIRELWNGRYFINYFDTTKKTGCINSHISQVAGEFFGRLCGLGPLYGDHYVRESINSMLALNYHPRFIFPVNEATPEGKMPGRAMWGWLPHVRVFLGGLPLYFGFSEEGMDILAKIDRVITEYNDDNRWDIRLFYEPDTGRQHWGRFYMTAPATWCVYQALLGYKIDKPAGLFEIIPNLPETLLPFNGPLFLPDIWMWLEVDKEKRSIRMKTLKKFTDKLIITRLHLPLWNGTLTVYADGIYKKIEHTGTCHRGEAYKCEINIAEITELLFQWR